LTDDESIIAKMRQDNFIAQFPDATLDWEHNTRAAFKLSRHYESGWQAHLTLHFTENNLYDVLMRFIDGDITDDAEDAYEQRINLHQDLLKEWLHKAPPYHYEWGGV